MITMNTSAVCHVRDGYTGRPLNSALLMCTLDGAPIRPLSKPGGYLILLDLPAGPHRLALSGHGYQEEWVDLQTGSEIQELEITMKPGAGYPFRGEVTRLELTVLEAGAPAPGRQLWLAAPAHWDLKIAQTKAEVGCTQFRLYCKGPETAVPAGAYLIPDEADSEVVLLQGLREEVGTLAAPLLREHCRSCPLMPAQCYRTDPDGRLSAVFHSPSPLMVYHQEKGLLATISLEQGDNRQTVSL